MGCRLRQKSNKHQYKKGFEAEGGRKIQYNGWCKCFRNIENNELGAYSSIGFGDPMTFEIFMTHYKNGDFYFDCGMHQSKNNNLRNYCQWRVRNKFIDSLIVSRHPQKV